MNNYVIGYDKGIKKDRSSLIISKYNNSNLYVLAEFYDEKADLLNEIITTLQQENKQLKEKIENITTMTVCGDKKQIKNTTQYKLELAEQKIEKAIEFIKEHIRIDDEYPDYMEMLIEERNELLEILGGKENE